MDLAGGGRSSAPAGRAVRAGLGEWLGGQSKLLPAQLLGLPELPHVSFDGAARSGGAHWKTGPLEEYGRGRAMAWIDDNFDQSCYEWAETDRADPAGPDRTAARPRGGPRRRLERLGRVSRLIAVTGFWPIFFLLVVLKIPVLGSIWLVWWASQATPEPDAAAEDADGGFKRRPGRSFRVVRAAVPTAAAPRCRFPPVPRAAAPGSSDPLRSLLSLAPDLAQIRMEVDLDRMTLRGDEALPHLPFFRLDLFPHLRRRR